jgi:nucleotide-binding universal stress UspA family protein
MVDDASLGLTIIAGYDGSDPARRALGRVRALHGHAGRVLVVVVTRDLRSEGLQAPLAGGAVDAQRLGEEAIGLLGGSQHGSVEARRMAGDPAVVLVDLAAEVGADLLVVGRRGGDFVARMLLGSVAERVVQHAPCDVLVVA